MKFSAACLTIAMLAAATHAYAELLHTAEIPPAASRAVDFKNDIEPLLQKYCIECHGPEKTQSNLRVDIRESLIEGGYDGPSLVPGDSANSFMIHLMATEDPDWRMPPQEPFVSQDDIALFRAWIDQGAAFDAAGGEDHEESAEVPGLDGWKNEATNQQGPLATWTAEDVPDGGTRVTLAETNHGETSMLNLLWTPEPPFQNGAISVRVKPIAGERDQGGGLIWRVQDKQNYYLCRYNPLQENLRIYRMQDGKVEKLAEAAIPKPENEWFEIAVTVDGENITATLDGGAPLEARDNAIPEPGGAGYWTKGDARSAFENFKAGPE